MDHYYYIENGNQNGPFNLEELKTKALKKNVQVWKEGMSTWIPAEELPELNDIFSSAPPTPLNPPFILPNDPEGNKEPNERTDQNKEQHKPNTLKQNLLGILGFLILGNLSWIITLWNIEHGTIANFGRSKAETLRDYAIPQQIFIAYVLLVVLILLVVIFLRRNTNKPVVDSILDPDDIEIYIEKIKKGNKVDVNGILDEGGALLVQERNGKQWRIDFRPSGNGIWMPNIKPGEEVNIIGHWRKKKKYVLVNFIYNKTTHKKGDSGFFNFV